MKQFIHRTDIGNRKELFSILLYLFFNFQNSLFGIFIQHNFAMIGFNHGSYRLINRFFLCILFSYLNGIGYRYTAYFYRYLLLTCLIQMIIGYHIRSNRNICSGFISEGQLYFTSCHIQLITDDIGSLWLCNPFYFFDLLILRMICFLFRSTAQGFFPPGKQHIFLYRRINCRNRSLLYRQLDLFTAVLKGTAFSVKCDVIESMARVFLTFQ